MQCRSREETWSTWSIKDAHVQGRHMQVDNHHAACPLPFSFIFIFIKWHLWRRRGVAPVHPPACLMRTQRKETLPPCGGWGDRSYWNPLPLIVARPGLSNMIKGGQGGQPPRHGGLCTHGLKCEGWAGHPATRSLHPRPLINSSAHQR